MKRTTTLTLTIALLTSSLALAQSTDMKDMNSQKHMEMKSSDMKDMDMQGINPEMMKDNGKKQPAKSVKNAKTPTHKAVAIVKEVDVAHNKVTLEHEAVKSLNWPAMTMGFTVKNKKLFKQLTVGKKVNIEFKQQGSDYVVTAVK